MSPHQRLIKIIEGIHAEETALWKSYFERIRRGIHSPGRSRLGRQIRRYDRERAIICDKVQELLMSLRFPALDYRLAVHAGEHGDVKNRAKFLALIEKLKNSIPGTDNNTIQAAIQGYESKFIEDEYESRVGPPEPFPATHHCESKKFTDAQVSLLKNLKDSCKTRKELAVAIGLSEEGVKHALKGLRDIVKNKRGRGYYRVDSPIK